MGLISRVSSRTYRQFFIKMAKAEGDKEATNTRQLQAIPEVEWIDDVEKYLADHGEIENARVLFANLDAQHGKYKYYEANVNAQRARCQSQVPEILSNLECIKILKKRQEADETAEQYFKVNETIYMKSEIEPTKTVGLWLGANVMLEFELEEAEELLNKNLETANTKLKNLAEDSAFLKDQMTMCEVMMARAHNYDVTSRRLESIKKAQSAVN